jgi:hypothetical protein
MEQVISLAARMIKGEGCRECRSPEYESPIRGSTDLMDEFVDALIDLVNIASSMDIDLSLTLCKRAKFSITKLATVYDDFDWLQKLFEMRMETDELEEMWCHGNQKCWCWDFGGRSDEHLEQCWHVVDNNDQDWYGYEDYCE